MWAGEGSRAKVRTVWNRPALPANDASLAARASVAPNVRLRRNTGATPVHPNKNTPRRRPQGV